MNRLMLPSVLMALLAIPRPLPLPACTIFSAHNASAVLAGNNEDWSDRDSWIWFEPPSGGRFGMVLTGFGDFYAQGGMNERGLFFDWVASIGGKPAPEDPTKKPLRRSGTQVNFGERVLATCETVDQALKLFNVCNVPDIGYAQIMLADRKGNSAVARWDWASSRILVDSTVHNYQAVGFGNATVSKALAQDSQTITMDRFRDLAASAIQPGYTVYTSIYDLKNGEIRLYYLGNYSVQRSWNIHDELRRGPHRFRMCSLFK